MGETVQKQRHRLQGEYFFWCGDAYGQDGNEGYAQQLGEGENDGQKEVLYRGAAQWGRQHMVYLKKISKELFKLF
ncbi:hypothetical protein [uncultured Desulfovibrio sp.]|uniref:hypothetical protein n=1 Tax=uncultured Desulfovibrio sp. TaxID=167968 RepID=UPI00262B6915|nr:hypothetical protein [uncultured Desulfovibrio sp.]